MRLFVTAIMLGLLASAAHAQTPTARVTATGVRTGWNADSFAIMTNPPIVNPANCPTPDGYISHSTHPGYKTYLSAALTAISGNIPIVVTVNNTECFAGRPVILGVNLNR